MQVTVIILFLYLKYVYCVNEAEVTNMVDESSHADLTKNTETFVFSKAPRFLTFNKEANKIRVEAAFAIPFLTIPVGSDTTSSTQDSLSVPKLDVNLKSITIVTGIFVLIFLILPKLLHIYFPSTGFSENFFSRPYAAKNLDSVMQRVLDAFDKYNMDFGSCTRKAMCWTVNNAATNVKEGKASGFDKLLDAVSSMPYLKYVFEDTWLWSILETTIFFKNNADGSCEKYSSKCSITGNSLNIAAGSLLASIRNKKRD